MHAISSTDDITVTPPTPIDRTGPAFEPGRYLIDLKGKAYLPVAARIAWLRSEFPSADITTTPIRIDDTIAIFAAHVAIPGRGSATGHGSETPAHFPDYIEKSETKALGRALAALGFGTAFACDLDEGDRLADAPVSRPANGYRGTAATTAINGHVGAGGVPLIGSLSSKQHAFASELIGRLGIDDAALATSLQREYGVGALAELSRGDASALIDRLKLKVDALTDAARA